jgi:hypothetical protein
VSSPLLPHLHPNGVGTGCKFTHVFSPYKTTDQAVLAEYRLAEQSWVRAAEHAAAAAAAATGGALGNPPTVVEFIAAVLPSDTLSPQHPFAKVVELTESIADGRAASLPTVREILKVGAAAAARTQSSHLIFTNWDILVVTTFYADMCRTIKAATEQGWLIMDVTRFDVKAGANALQTKPSLAELDGPKGPGNFIREHGHKHPGHDCFIVPMAMDLSCVLEEFAFVVSQPPWGMLLRSVLQRIALEDDSGGQFRYMRSSQKHV